MVWTVDQKFLSNGSKHCVQLKIFYFLLYSTVEILSEKWHDVRVHIYFQEIDNDDDINKDLYTDAYNSIQSYKNDNNNDDNNIGYQNKRSNTNKLIFQDYLNNENESKDGNDDRLKNENKNKEKDITNWLKGRLIIKFGSSGEKVLEEEEEEEECSLPQGLTSLRTLHRVLIDAGGGCAVQHGAQYKALGSGTPFNGARDKDRDGDGTITGALNSVNINKRNNDNKNSSKTKKYKGAYDGGLTCWIPCGVLLADSYKEHSPHQEPSPSRRRDYLMDLFVDPSERQHSSHKQKSFTLDFDKKKQEKKLRKEIHDNTHIEINQKYNKNRKKSWIRLTNANTNKDNRKEKNEEKELKVINVEVTANKWEFKNEQLNELNELKSPSSPSSPSSIGCLIGLNLNYSNSNIAGYIRDKKWSLNDNCTLDRDRSEWPAPHGRMRRGTGSNNESYAILDTGRPYWKSSPIFSHSSSTTPPSSPNPLSPHSHLHIASYSAFSNSPPSSPSLSHSRSSTFISSPNHFASTPFPPPFSPQPSHPKNSSKIQQELYGPQHWPSNVDNVNGKKDTRTSANKEKTKLRASLNALSSAAMLSTLVDEDLKEYNHTTYTFEIKSIKKNKNKQLSRRNSFSAVLNRLSNSFCFSTKSPSVSI